MASVPRIIPQCVDAHIRWYMDNQRCENVLQFGYNVVPTSTQLASLALQLGTVLVPKMQPFMSANCTFTEVRCDDIGGLGRATGLYPFPAGVTGSRGGSQVPNNVAASMQLTTGLRGRVHKGAKRLGGFTTDELSGDILLNFLITYLGDLAVQYLATRVGGMFFPVVGSMKDQITTPLTAVKLVNNIVDSQKTRLPQHGT